MEKTHYVNILELYQFQAICWMCFQLIVVETGFLERSHSMVFMNRFPTSNVQNKVDFNIDVEYYWWATVNVLW